MSVCFCGGSCIEDVTSHLMYHLSLHPTLRTCSADTILRAIKELTQDNISYTSDTGKTYDFNTADKLNTLLLNCLLSTGQLKEGEGYDVDFDHQFIEAEIAYAADIVAFAFVGTLAASFAVILCTFALVAALQMYFSQNDYDQDYNPPNLFPYL